MPAFFLPSRAQKFVLVYLPVIDLIDETKLFMVGASFSCSCVPQHESAKGYSFCEA